MYAIKLASNSSSQPLAPKQDIFEVKSLECAAKPTLFNGLKGTVDAAAVSWQSLKDAKKYGKLRLEPALNKNDLVRVYVGKNGNDLILNDVPICSNKNSKMSFYLGKIGKTTFPGNIKFQQSITLTVGSDGSIEISKNDVTKTVPSLKGYLDFSRGAGINDIVITDGINRTPLKVALAKAGL